MGHKTNKREAFNEIRLIVYAVIVVNGIYIQYFAPFHTLCELEQNSCLMCGMRQAINLLLLLDFYGAYRSNHGIIVIIIFACVMIIDVVFIFKNHRSKEFRE